ncbi:hypothetical protein J3R30DRAFT_3500841 [Lentinula aciculospora]|uniref:Uncharacterized protein n=1 Tax=Lentinula aciculospora TaxID=153920 RepID=A0A9W9A6K0_9AGAR|nr:hypothetical protein J3R30DRAFT_3500841 [Lentinula aciculospora]
MLWRMVSLLLVIVHLFLCHPMLCPCLALYIQTWLSLLQILHYIILFHVLSHIH